MAYKLTSLPKTQYSGLNYDNIIEDIVNLIQDNPNYNENWDDFLSSNAGRMMTELFAYIADQLATRIDWIVNEHFIGTATQRRSVINMLKLIGYTFTLPTASTVGVNVILDRAIGDLVLTEAFNPNADNVSFSPYTLVAKDKSGETKNFECVYYNEASGKYDYLSSLKLETGETNSSNLNQSINFYEGTTYIETFTSITDNNPIFELSKKSIVSGSVVVYLVQDSESSEIVEALSVDSFLDPDAQKSEDAFGNAINIPYLTNVLDEDGVSIEFAPTSLLSSIDRRLEEGGKIRVIYRVGGGSSGNIAKQAINTSVKISTQSDGETIITNVIYKNIEEGIGGEDSETVEHAAAYAPLTIRTAEKAVTENDYDILLNSESTILKSKTYGNSNMPVDIYEQYGIYIKPLEVWNYILKTKPGWESAKPSEYNDFQWIGLREENRFNEKHYFSKGDFGISNSILYADLTNTASLDPDGVGSRDFNNYIYLTSPTEYKENYTDASMRFRLTKEENTTNFCVDLNAINFFTQSTSSNSGMIDATHSSIYNPVHAEVTGTRNLINGIDVDTQVFSPVIDNITLISDLTLSGVSSTATEIVSAINTKYSTDANFGNSLAVNKGYQTVSFINTPTTSTTTGLTAETIYYFYVNDEEFSITTGLASPTYAELIDLINAQFTVYTTTGTVTFGSYDITDVVGIENIEKGYKFTIDGSTYSTSSEDVLDIFHGEDRFRIATLGDHTDSVDLVFYRYLCEFVDVDDDIKITSNRTQPYEAVILRPGLTGTDLFPSMTDYNTIDLSIDGGNKVGFQNLGLIETLVNVAAIATGDYNFIINGYKYTINVLVSDTWNEIITKMDTVTHPNFTVAADTNDILITADNFYHVEVGVGTAATDLLYALHGAIHYFTSDTMEGGGDYSTMASIYYGAAGEEYVKIKSPSKGEYQSNITLPTTSSNFMGTDRAIASKVYYGANKLTLITSAGSLSADLEGDFILELGNITTSNTTKTLYSNYLIDIRTVLEIGKYFYNTYESTHIKHRSIADRLYGMVYDQNGNIDFSQSKFDIRFTKEATEKNSIYSIASDWNLVQSAAANVSSIDVDSMTTMAANYNIRLNIDGNILGPVTIDLTGDNGTTPFPTKETMISKINTALNDAYVTTAISYAVYDYINNKIIISSQTYKDASSVTIHDITNEATNIFFGLADLSGVETHEYLVTGDYYIEYDNEIITDGVPTEVYEETRNYLKLLPIATSTADWPDLEFYVSFVFDQTVVDGAYDGEFIETTDAAGGGTNDTVVGIAFGSLDEDIYYDNLGEKKIVGIDNIFKETKFSTFDLVGTIYYDSLFSQSTIQENLETKLDETYNLEIRDYNELVSRSKIMKALHDVSGISYIEIDYFGKDYNDQTTYPTQENTIECDFDEIIVLSEKRYYFGVQTNGIIFNYKPLEK